MYRVPAYLLLIGSLACAVLVPASADAKDAYKAYQKFWAQGRYKDACEALGSANTTRAAKTLLQILFKHMVVPKDEKPEARAKRLEVVEGCTGGFAQLTDPKALKILAGVAGNRRLKPEQKAPIIEAFGKMRNKAGAELLIALHKKARTAEQKIGIAEAMETNGNPALEESWIRDLKSSYWMVQVAAIKSLARQKSKKAVTPLIGLVANEHPKVSYWAHQALVGMTGEDHQTDAQEWKLWWKKNQDKPLAGGGLGSKAKKKSGSVSFRTPTYYGLKFRAKYVAFVIDISGSMGEIVKGNLKKPQPDKRDKRPVAMRYDWSSIRNRMDLAKAHLVYTIGHLEKRTYFNIFYYASNNQTWRDNGWVQATDANKVAAIDRVKKLSAGGGTNIYEALQKAFEFPGKGPRPLEKAIKKGVDTVFLMTDGIPTSGTITQSTPNYRERYVQTVTRWAKGRKIKVHTIGVGRGHDGRLLSMIAKATGGQYTTAGD